MKKLIALLLLIPALAYSQISFSPGDRPHEGQLLQSNKVQSNPNLTAGSANNLVGGATNKIPYQTGSGTTGFISPVNSALVVTSSGGVPSESIAIPNGVTATTQPCTDASSLISNNAFVQCAIQLSMSTVPINVAADTVGTISFDSIGSPPAIARVTTVSSGAITAASILSAGGSSTAFKTGDVIGCVQTGSNNDALLQVASLSGGGVASVNVLYGGTGYTASTGCSASPFYASVPFTFTLSGLLPQSETYIMTYGSYLTQSNQWIFNNNTTGAYTVTAKIGTASDTATGTGVVIPQGTNNGAYISTDGSTDVLCVSGYCPHYAVINGGTINGTSVGATTPSTGKFTTLGVTSSGAAGLTTTGTTGSTTALFTNTGGSLYFGLDNSSGGGFGTAGAYGTVIYRPASTGFAISRGGTIDMSFSTSGIPTFSQVTTGTNADFACFGSGNVLQLQSSACTISSKRFKDDLGAPDIDVVGSLRQWNLVMFKMKGDAFDPDINHYRPQFGLYAEDVAKIDPRLAIYEQDGATPKSYRQESLIALLGAGWLEHDSQLRILWSVIALLSVWNILVTFKVMKK